MLERWLRLKWSKTTRSNEQADPIELRPLLTSSRKMTFVRSPVVDWNGAEPKNVISRHRAAPRYLSVMRRKRFVAWAKQLRADAASLPAGLQKDQLLDKARHADAASHKWANSRGLRPPT